MKFFLSTILLLSFLRCKIVPQVVTFTPSSDFDNKQIMIPEMKSFAEKLGAFLKSRNIEATIGSIENFIDYRHIFINIFSGLKDLEDANVTLADYERSRKLTTQKIELITDYLWLSMKNKKAIELFIEPHACSEDGKSSQNTSYDKEIFSIYSHFHAKRANAKLIQFFQPVERRTEQNLSSLPLSYISEKEETVYYSKAIMTLFDSYPRPYRVFKHYFKKHVAGEIPKIENMTCSVTEMARFFFFADRLHGAFSMKTDELSTEERAKRNENLAEIFSLKVKWAKTMNKIFLRVAYLSIWQDLLKFQAFLEDQDFDHSSMIKLFQVIMSFHRDINSSWDEQELINSELQEIEMKLKGAIIGLELRNSDNSKLPLPDFSKFYEGERIFGVLMALLMLFFMF